MSPGDSLIACSSRLIVAVAERCRVCSLLKSPRKSEEPKLNKNHGDDRCSIFDSSGGGRPYVLYGSPIHRYQRGPAKVYTIDGEECYKKQNIETYLFLGVDAAGDSRNTKQKKNQSVQCDSVILLVIDRVNKTFAILPLDRDAMVSLEIPDEDGNILGENTMQLALAYAYGDGKEQSCELAEDAVSGLLHDQRIDGYVSLSMDAIGAVNHLVGGVDVTVTDDFAGESGLASGQTVHLSDAQAETFVRGRKSVGDGTNENRMNRQQIPTSRRCIRR